MCPGISEANAATCLMWQGWRYDIDNVWRCLRCAAVIAHELPHQQAPQMHDMCERQHGDLTAAGNHPLHFLSNLSLHETVARLRKVEIAIMAFFCLGPMFRWTSRGGGGMLPDATEIDWDGSLLTRSQQRQFARIDFYRPEPDFENRDWCTIVLFMTSVASETSFLNNDVHEVGVANWMESLIGSCSALMHMGATLPMDSFIVIVPSAGRGWYHLQGMGTEAEERLERWFTTVMGLFERLVTALQEAGFRL